MLYLIHIPKTAGTSLRRFLSEHVFPGRLYPVYEDIGYWNAAQTRASLRGDEVLFGHFCYGFHRLMHDPSPSYITFLRDPVERTISLYRHFRDRPGSEPHALIQAGNLSLREFVESGGCVETNNHMVKMIDANYGRVYRWWHHASNRWSQATGGPRFYQVHGRSHLRRALHKLERHFVLVGLNEHFGAGVAALLRRCHAPVEGIELPRENVADGAAPVVLDARTRHAIETANDLDLELYHRVQRDPERYHAVVN